MCRFLRLNGEDGGRRDAPFICKYRNMQYNALSDSNLSQFFLRNQYAKKGKTKFSKQINGQKMKKSKEIIVLRYVLLNENFIQIK